MYKTVSRRAYESKLTKVKVANLQEVEKLKISITNKGRRRKPYN